MLAVDPINAVGAGVPQSPARSRNAAETLLQYTPPEGGGGEVVVREVEEGGIWTCPSPAWWLPDCLPPTSPRPPPAPLSIHVGNQHSFVKAN
ncbi:hypothetical protein CgunFtcFv8_019999 [Champsocephalus gunnari]|uniref:Uncharacterized protein n=1 Tax=Champsocephalus gunnari TaxID=52237 RepID=A0AAN8HP60_CHAGU|nr:hypothetical protein CgunFtcFv8_019999 [Champsocephalus gunnari]